jgi:exodeoxyribonuclease-3
VWVVFVMEGTSMGFRLVTLNLNGIRSAASKGFMPWTESIAPDCMGVQEVKAQASDVQGKYDTVAGMAGHFHFAEKKGYSGVGMYSRHEPSDVIVGLGEPEFDAEGRYVELRFDKPGRQLSLISCYFPSGSSGEERQQAKFRFLDVVYPHLHALKGTREFILVGDVNIAHKEIDLKNWKGNQKNSGFLPEERAWMTRLLDEAGWWMSTAACTRRPPARPTPGGATAARPTRRTWAGVWTTTWPRPAWPRRPARPPSTRTRSSATTRR